MLLEEAGSPLGLFESEQAAWSIQHPRLQRHVKNHNFIADVRSIQPGSRLLCGGANLPVGRPWVLAISKSLTSFYWAA